MPFSLTQLQVGAVLQPEWDARHVRVLAFDQIEIFYDGWWPHKNNWGFTKLTGKASYYRIPTNLAMRQANFLRLEPLNDEELSVHRPDLPLRLCRSAKIQWSSTAFPTLNSYQNALLAEGVNQVIDNDEIALAVSDVVLKPFGPKGGIKPSKAIKASQSAGFTEVELLWRAHNLQSAHSSGFNTGVGIYRLGMQGGKPSYYIWGNFDRAGFLGKDKTYFGHYD